jgi:hypothetical protein
MAQGEMLEGSTKPMNVASEKYSAATNQSRFARNQNSGNSAANQENPYRTITVRTGLPVKAGR